MEIINGQQGTTQVRSTYLPAQSENWPDMPNEPRGQIIAQRTFTGAHLTQGSGHHFKRVADAGAYTMPELAPNGNIQMIDKNVDRIVEVIRLVPVQKVVERLVERLQVYIHLHKYLDSEHQLICSAFLERYCFDALQS